MGTVRVAGLSQMNSILGTGARHRFFQPTMTFRILSMRLRSQTKRKTMCSIPLVSTIVLEITPNMKVPTEVTGMRHVAAEEAYIPGLTFRG